MNARAAAVTGRASRTIPDALRRDVRLLTTLLGDAIRETEGPDLYDAVETLRRACVSYAADPTPARRRRCQALVAPLRPEDGIRLARAFTAYFQLVNVAEDRERVRTLRERGTASPPPVQGDVELIAVLTAHPTEARRRATLEHLWRIGDLLDSLDDPRCAGRIRDEHLRKLREQVTGLWLTDPVRHAAPDPLDEVRAAMALFDRTIFTTLPRVRRTTGPGVRVRWGTWVGADRDGNPQVTADVTVRAAGIARDHLLRGYEQAARGIARSLSASDRDVRPSSALRTQLRRAAGDLPDRHARLVRVLPDAPHRRALVLIADRIGATRASAGVGYADASAFAREVETVRASLRAGGATTLADGELADLAAQIEAFGFHLASIEVRQHAAVLRRACLEPDQAVGATFAAIARIQAELGEAACHRLVVSFTRSADDVAAAYTLARRADPRLPRRLDVVPLFESSAELANAPAILDEIVALPAVEARLHANGGHLEVMLGYSDSAKEVGMLAASIRLYEAQRVLAGWARARGIALTLFHGRGGALGRGGGPTARAIRAQPPGTVAGRFKVTEQGEVASARYGDPDIAWHHVEQLVRAIADAPGEDAHDPADDFTDATAAMRDASETAWHRLITTPGFAGWFTASTPIRHVATLPIASRPVSRSATVEDLDALRAIPWVFAWSQARVNLPGWFGLGAGLEAVASGRGGLARLRSMHRRWPFFAVVCENAELALAKADRALAERYLARGERTDIVAQIQEEWDRTERLLLAIAGKRELLESRRALRTAIDLRAPAVDALGFLQLRSLDDRRAARLVQTTIGGIAAGLQNTG
jgi:phosphoenolpyruvate carboxylase